MIIKEIIQKLRTTMIDARGQESHFESWLTQNEGICDAIDMLKELAKQEQGEPVTNDPLPRACNLAGVDYQTFLKIKAYMPVYTTPQQRKPLTDEQQKDAARYQWLRNPLLMCR
jgi:hypothetical protein